MIMELRQLRYLVVIAEEANFTRAAEKVFVSQSALSQQIQSLEQEVGTVLLDRSKRGVRLTSAGEILYRHALHIFSELDQAKIAIQELEGLQRGELRVGVVQTVNDYLMPSIVTLFSQYHPQIKLFIDELSSSQIERGLADGTLQVGVGFIPASSEDIHTEPLFHEELALIVRHDHPLANRHTIPIKALDNMEMIMLSNTFCTRQLWEENARLASIQPKIVMEMNTVSSILAVVEKTSLVTVLPKFTLEKGIPNSLRCIHLSEPTLLRQVGLLWHDTHYLCSASRAFISQTKHAVEMFYPATNSL